MSISNIHDALEEQAADRCDRIAEAFRAISRAACTIAEELGADDVLNESVPSSWPLNLSADEFAAECWTMAEYYESLAKDQREI